MAKTITIETPTTGTAISALANEFNGMRTSAKRRAIAALLEGMTCSHGYILVDGYVYRYNGFNGGTLTHCGHMNTCNQCEQAAEDSERMRKGN